MKFTFLIPFVFFSIFPAIAQMNLKDKETSLASKYAESILTDDLSRHLYVIAADSMEGRMTGSAGQKKAARYIMEHFKSLGLKPPVSIGNSKSYFQEFRMVKKSWGEVYIRIGEEKMMFLKDMYVLKNSTMSKETEMEIVFGGTGAKSDLEHTDLRDKGVICLESDEEDSKKSNLVRNRGAKTIFIVTGKNQSEFEEKMDYNGYYLKREIQEMSNPNAPDNAIFYISPATAAKMLGVSETDLFQSDKLKTGFKGRKVFVKAEKKEKPQFGSENVLGYLEGTDKKDEVIVITAHYDHIGKTNGEVNNGADDDGSGTVTVMEIAEAFVKAKLEGHGPRRSILFMTVAGEEMGLYGSSFYADIDPIFPLEKTVCNLNIDMVGRIGGEYIEKNDPNYIYLIGSDKLSQDLHRISEETNKKFTRLKLDYKYNDENDPNRFYYRSDHYNFAKNNIPIIFYFNGTHDDYHQPTDDVKKIHFPKMEKIGRLIFYTAWEIANRDERIKVDKK